MPDYVKIPVDIAKRIAKATRYVERIPQSNLPSDGKRQFADEGFWARLTDTDDEGKYSWERVYLNTDFETTTDGEYTGSYEDDANFAVEINNNVSVPIDSIVYLMPSFTADCFVFLFGDAVERFAQLTDTLEKDGSCDAALYDEDMELDEENTVEVSASPLFCEETTLADETDVLIRYFPFYDAWYVVNASCCGNE
jgi:hypothetical protein